MVLAAAQFLDSVKALKGCESIKFIKKPRESELKNLANSFNQAAVESVLGGIANGADIDLIAPFLGLPDKLQIIWELDGSFGETQIISPLAGWFAPFPSAYSDVLKGFAPIENIGILDQTTDRVPTSFVIFDKTTPTKRGLWLFDTRSVESIDLNGEDYLRLSNQGFGFDSWQFLFSQHPILPDRREAIQKALDSLAENFSRSRFFPNFNTD